MFKKNVSTVQTSLLSGKDVKSLKRDIKLNFPDLEEHEISDLIPNKSEVSLLKLSNRAQAYTCNGKNPLFFDPEGRGDLLVPTVFVLWRFPHILPTLTTYSEVSPKGLIVPQGGLGNFTAGDLRSIVVPGNKYPFAVGLLEVGSEQVAKTGLSGRGLKLLHTYPDQLWGLGDKITPDKSFTPSRVFPQAAQGGAAADGQAEAAAAPSAANGSSPAARQHQSDPVSDATAALNLSSDKAALADESDDDTDAEPSSRSGPGPLAAKDQTPDSIVEACLLTGLHLVPDGELPLLTSTFWAKYMLQGKPADTSVDIKKTSYKKLSKLLSTFEKKGLLSVKLVHKQDHLASVNRMHALYAEAAALGESARETPASNEADSRGGQTSTSDKIDILHCYRVPSSLRPLFGAAPQSPEHLYNADEVAAALRSYAKDSSLQSPTGATDDVKLDRFLVSYIFGKKDPQQEGDVHPFADLHQRILTKLTLFHKVVRHTGQGDMEVVQRGSIKSIAIAMEDRQGGRKHITRVAHCEAFSIDPNELAGVLQRKFKTNASIQKLPGKNETGKEIALQGDLLHEVPKFLQESYGISSEYIDVKSKPGK